MLQHQLLLVLAGLTLLLDHTDATPIFGGRPVHNAVSGQVRFPFIVSLQERVRNSDRQHDGSSGKFKHFCGGSLVHGNWILTAAHCLWHKNLENIAAVIGHHNITNIRAHHRYAVQRVEYMHFHPTNLQNDIALLRLRNRYVPPPHLNRKRNEIFARLLPHGTKAIIRSSCKIVGYGAVQYGGAAQDHLKEAEVSVISHEQCRHLLGHVWAPQEGQNTVCALGNEQDTCQGDSGGPLICEHNNGGSYVYAIVSHGVTCGLKSSPGVYTLTGPYSDWVTAMTKD